MPKKFPNYVYQSPKKDPQQNLVYYLEGNGLQGIRDMPFVSQKAAKNLAFELCKNYDVSPVKVRFVELEGRLAEYDSSLPVPCISMNKNEKSIGLLILLHEFAHHLHFEICAGLEQQDHGPEYMACYMSVLDCARVIPISGMAAILDEYGVKYCHPGKKNSLSTLRRVVRRSK